MNRTAEHQFLSISGLLKATPSEEGGRRLLYLEASNENVDLHGERVLAKSLHDSSEYFLRHGNIDLDHRTLMAPRGPGDNPYLWEIGRPVEVQADGDRTLVKAELYRGDGVTAANANMVWDSLTRQAPAATWYPSVGGQILDRRKELDPLTKASVTVIRRVRWNNIALSRTPVNASLPPVAVVDVGTLTKCLTANGCLNLTKALEAGYGTDAAALEGGAALRRQSLDPAPQATLPIDDDELFPHVRSLLALRMRREGLSAHIARRFGVPSDQAERLAARFQRELSAHLIAPGGRHEQH